MLSRNPFIARGELINCHFTGIPLILGLTSSPHQEFGKAIVDQCFFLLKVLTSSKSLKCYIDRICGTEVKILFILLFES